MRHPLVRAIGQNVRAALLPTIRLVQERLRSAYHDLRRTQRAERPRLEPVHEQWRRILRHSRSTLARLPPPSGPRILFPVIHGFGGNARMAFETVLAMALRLRGVDVSVTACGKALPACEGNSRGNYSPPPPDLPGEMPPLYGLGRMEACSSCTASITNPFNLLPVRQYQFNALLQSGDLERVEKLVAPLPYEDLGRFVYEGVNVGEHARASMMRATLRGTLLDDEYTRRLYRRYLMSIVLIVDLSLRMFREIRPDRIAAMHGVYATHGTVCEVARKQGVGVVVFCNPFRKGTIWLSHHDTYHRTLITEPTSLWEDLELTPAMSSRVEEYLSAKRLGGRDYVTYHADATNEWSDIVQELRLDPAKPVVTMYTNVLWDAQLYYEGNAFTDMLEWMYETIRYFAKRPELQLAIRLHPAEVRGALPTKQPLKEEIAREFPQLPANVRVVAPESTVSSYTLAEHSTAALIYGARMGVEIAMLGTPLIIAGETFNRRKGFSYDASSREEYFSLLDRLPHIPRNTPEMIRRARLYAYHFLFRLMIDFPLISVNDGILLSDPRLEFDTLEDLAPGRCPALDVMCQGILDGKSPFLYDSSGNT